MFGQIEINEPHVYGWDFVLIICYTKQVNALEDIL